MFGNEKVFNDVLAQEVLNDPETGIEFTLLDPRATAKDIDSLISIAYKNKYYSVVVPQCFVKYARNQVDTKYSSALKVCTVVGFPLGSAQSKVKVVEAKTAIKNGANELDVMINLHKVKEGDYGYIKQEMNRIARISRKVVVKAIIETAYLTLDELEKVVHALARTRIDFVMTCTGYAPLGADIETAEKIMSILGKSHVKIKAAGGIKTKAQAENLFRVGVSRVGTSRIL